MQTLTPADRGLGPPDSPGRWVTLRVLLRCALVTPVLRRLIIAFAVPAGQPWRDRCPHCQTPVHLRSPGPPAGDTPAPGGRLPRLRPRRDGDRRGRRDRGPATGRLRRLRPRPLGPTARCTGCRTCVGAPAYTVEAVTLAALTLVAAVVPRWALPALIWWTLLGIVLAFVDAAVGRLPNRLTLTAAVGTALLLAPATVAGHTHAWVRALLAGAILLFFGLTLALPRRTGLGLGDAKYLLAVGITTGCLSWFAVLLAVFLSFTGLAIAGTALIALGKRPWHSALPFVPFLLAGTLTTLALLTWVPV